MHQWERRWGNLAFFTGPTLGKQKLYGAVDAEVSGRFIEFIARSAFYFIRKSDLAINNTLYTKRIEIDISKREKVESTSISSLLDIMDFIGWTKNR